MSWKDTIRKEEQKESKSSWKDTVRSESEETILGDGNIAAGTAGLGVGLGIKKAQDVLGDDLSLTELTSTPARKIQQFVEDIPIVEDFAKAARIRSTGRDVVGKSGAMESLEKSKELAKDFTEKVDDKRKTVGKKLGKTLEQADAKVGAKNVNEQLNQLERQIKSVVKSAGVTEDTKKRVQELEDLLEKSKQNIGKTRTFTKQTPTDIFTMKQNMGEILDSTPKGTQAFKEITKAKKQVEKLIPENLDKLSNKDAARIKDIYESTLNQYRALNEIGELEPQLKKGLKGQENLADIFRRTTDDTTAGLKKISTYDELFDRMQTAGIDSDTIDRFRKGIQTEADIMELTRKSKKANILGFDLLKNLAVRAGSATGSVLGSKPVKMAGRGILKSLPVVGAAATFAGAKASGASDLEAAGLTALDEATDVALAVPKMALMPSSTGGDELAKTLESPESTQEQRLKAEIDTQREALANPDLGKENKEFARRRLEQVQAEYSRLKNPEKATTVDASATPTTQQIETVLNTIKLSDNPSYRNFIPTLERAMAGSTKEKQQAQFELKQQPAFRRMLKDLKLE